MSTEVSIPVTLTIGDEIKNSGFNRLNCFVCDYDICMACANRKICEKQRGKKSLFVEIVRDEQPYRPRWQARRHQETKILVCFKNTACS